jgi:NADPH-dependent glutamate synthase beta subunit-like oxidoreductase/ferredoxin
VSASAALLARAVVPDAEWLWQNEPCRAACPVHTDAGAYVTAIAEGRLRDAYRIARAPNPFPSVCGRVCAAPCEAVCRRGALDAPVAIRALKRFVADRFGAQALDASAWHEAHGPVPSATLPSVGIIGGGPGGLAAAHDLRLAGHAVRVYEAADTLGGMMVLGIPPFRLPRDVLFAEIDAILSLGVEVRGGCRVGEDVPLGDLLDRHAALFLAVGTGRGRDLAIPGHELDGVLRAIEFLLNANRGFQVELGERVVVIGGGNVAMDAARMALRAAGGEPAEEASSLTTSLDAARAAKRAGAREVTVVTLESRDEMPASDEEIEQALVEGIRFLHRRAAARILGDGHVAALETLAVSQVFDASGRFAPVTIPGTNETIDADTVLLAVGQTADLSWLTDVPIARSAWGGLAVDRDTLRTSHPKIWAGGDVAFGPRNLIDAIADGRRAAASVHAALTGDFRAATPRRMRLSCASVHRGTDTAYDARPRTPEPSVPTARRIGQQEVELGYENAAARDEGDRCLRCFENVMLRPERCILCGLCVDVCPMDCIRIVAADGNGRARSALVLDETRCIRCALCVDRCPPDALTLVRAEEVPLG